MTQSEEPMSAVAKRIREARDAHGWSQEELAEHAGVSRPSIARIERGDDVNTATLVKVAYVLGLTLEVQVINESDSSQSGV
ncbi:helix-turn-helix domain-containing protein [Nocardioides sp. WG-D5]